MRLILTWQSVASCPACHALRRGCRRCDQLYCRRRHFTHLPCSNLAWSRSKSCKWYEHRCSLAWSIWRSIRLQERTREQFHHSVSIGNDECYRWGSRRVVADLHAVTNLCANGSLANPICDHSL